MSRQVFTTKSIAWQAKAVEKGTVFEDIKDPIFIKIIVRNSR